MRRWLLGLMVWAMGLLLWGPWAEAASHPSLEARAAILLEGRTGTILYEKNAFQQMDPASLTKMMTALLVIKHGHLEHLVTISRRSANTPGSALHIRYQEQYTRLDLLKGLLLRSGNDASIALAESDAGSVERFVAQMNLTAQELGAFNTQFENPNGLTKPGHYSSAYDLALIAQQGLTLSLFREIVGSSELTIMEQGHHRPRLIHSTNQLLYGFPGADGVKTGTTNAAGKCLVASATRNGRQLIAVVLDSPDRWGDASRLLNWGFHHSSLDAPVRNREVMAHSEVMRGQRAAVGLVSHETVWVALTQGESPMVHLHYPHCLTAPVKESQRVGYASIEVPYQPSLVIPLYTKRSVARMTWRQEMGHWLKRHVYPR